MNNTYQAYQAIASVEPGTRVLFANFPADGHFNPLTGLAVHLKKKGCDVRWYTSVAYEEKIKKMGLQFYGLKKAIDINPGRTDIDAVFPERKNHKTQISKLKFDMIHAFILRGTEYYEDLQEIYQEFNFDIMIADITFGGIPFVKELMDIPVIAVSVIPLPETSRDLPPPGLGLIPSKSYFGKIRQRLLRFVANKLIFSKPNKVMEDMLGDYGIDTQGAGIFDIMIRKSSVVLQSGTPGFEYERSDMSPHINFAGPLLPWSVKKSSEPWYDKRLNQYNKIILVTQGTVENDIHKLLVPAIEAFKDPEYLLVVTTGGAKTKELREMYARENLIIEDFIPFDDIMPYTDVYISNGGYGGVLLSVQHSIPMVVAGIHEGKNEINARVEYFKMGINLRTEKPTASQLEKSVLEVLENPVYAQNVKKLSKEFKTYNPNQICESQVARLVNSKRAVLVKTRQEEEFIY